MKAGRAFDGEFWFGGWALDAEFGEGAFHAAVPHWDDDAWFDGFDDFEGFFLVKVGVLAEFDHEDVNVADAFDEFAFEGVAEFAEVADGDAVDGEAEDDGFVSIAGAVFFFWLGESAKSVDRHFSGFVFAGPVEDFGFFWCFSDGTAAEDDVGFDVFGLRVGDDLG